MTIDNPAVEETEADTAVCFKSIAQQILAYRSELVDRYVRALREDIFAGRIELRPSTVKSIAEKEADFLLDYLVQTDSSCIDHGVELSRIGLSHLALLRMGKATRQFLMEHLEPNLVTLALDAAEDYQMVIIQGFMLGRETIILAEQERIRNAVDRTLSRYTVEIKEVQEMAQKASEISMFKSRLIGQVSHELRTPLGGLLGVAEIIEQQIYGPLNEKQLSLIRRVISNAQILNSLLSSLLDQSHIESGKLLLKAQEFSPKAVAQAVHSNQLPFALQKGLALNLKVSTDLRKAVIGDQVRTAQIITNLINNAIKYTDSGQIDVNVYPVGDTYWAIEVIDTGIGIPKDAHETIFEPFQRVDLRGLKEPGGVGLGLAIVKQLVEALNGKVSLKSEVGQGSTFTVVLPVCFTLPAGVMEKTE